MSRVSLILVVLGLATAARAQDLGQPLGPDPDAPTAAVSIDHADAYVGDRLALTVTAIARGGIAVTLPQKLELGPAELLERDDSESGGRDLGDGRRQFRFFLYVSLYEVGPAEIPSLSLTYVNPKGERRTVSTAAVPVTIRALVDEMAKAGDPQPERAPRSALIEDRRIVGATWAIGGAAALAILFVLARRLLRRVRRGERVATGPVVPTRPPGEVAIERLTAIRARGEFERDGYRPFAFEVAEVVRAYLGARYGFDSLELTSTELLEELRRAAPHLAEPGSEVVRFIDETDLVKFAKAGGSSGMALELLDTAQAIVLSTAPRLEAAAEMLSGPVRPPMPLDPSREPGDGGGA